MCSALWPVVVCFLCELNRQIELKTGGYDFGRTAMRTIAANEMVLQTALGITTILGMNASAFDPTSMSIAV